MLTVRCKNCNTLLESHPSQTKCCGCENMTRLKNDVISAIDLSLVEIVSGIAKTKNNSVFSRADLEFQEARRKRKVRKLDFEIR
jgi:hypothetical protein